MKPLKLILEAFGPYVTKQEIDFTRFDGQNLFVITGPTGAGKTTIFDAISFALFGDSSGDSRESENFKSDYAPDDAVSRVEFAFFLKGKEYRIIRYPKQTRLSSRGNLRVLNSDAELTLPDGSTVTGVRNVDPLVVELLGISKDRFKQIAMLPQGEYKKLLYAGSKEKQEIFRKVFSTQDYQHITEALQRQAKKMEEELSERQKSIRLHLSMYQSKDAELSALLQAEQLDLPRILDGMEQEHIRLEQQAKEMETDIQVLSSKLQALGLAEAQQLNARFDLLDQLVQRHKILSEQRGEAVRWERMLSSIARAKELSYAKAELVELKKRMEYEQIQTEQAEASLQQAEKEAKAALKQQEQLPVIQKMREQTAAQIAALEQERTTVSLLEKAHNDLLSMRTAEGKLQKREEIFSLLLQRRELLQTLDSLNLQGQLSKQLAAEAEAFWKASEAYTLAQQNYDTVYTAFLQGQAGLLAASLKTGVPCPVCGSIHHPSPAISKQEIPSEQHLEQCKQVFDKTTQTLREIDTRARVLLEKLNAAWTNQEEPVGIEPGRLYQSQTRLHQLIRTFDTQAKQLLQQLEELKKELLQYPGITQSLLEDPKYREEEFLNRSREKNAQGLTDQSSKIRGLEERISVLKANLSSGASTASELEEKLKLARDRAWSLQKQADEVSSRYQRGQESLVRAQESLRSYRERWNTDQALCTKKQREFTLLIEKQGFADASDFEKTLSFITEEDEFREKLTEYVRETAECESQKTLLETELSGKQRQNLEKMKEQEKLLNEQQKQCSGELSALQALLFSNLEHSRQVKALYQSVKDQEDEYARLVRLARLASGNNEAKVDFERYVLAAYFDDIIEASNQRLSKMTGYRYLLRRKLERGKYAKASGLDFEVIDSWNGKARDITTLSGGEGFQASLALALGVADVMQMVSGGIEMNTMFIDEGFGTLDPQALDEAIRTLTELTSENRLIGIISHVSDLKERIPAHIEVFPSRTGSSIHVVV